MRVFFVNIVTETACVSGMSLNGQNIASYFREVPGNPDYSYARIGTNPGTQMLSNPSGTFVAHAYGIGPCVSYAFSVGVDLSWNYVQVTENESDGATITYPNPGSNTLNICTAFQNACVEVYDMNGRFVHSQALTEQVTTIDAGDWPSGVYVWKVYTTGISNGSTTLAETGRWIKE